jgi:hypothetical protein
MATYNRIGLNIPEQSPPKGKLFYLNEKDTSEWIERLPLANIGETSRQLFQALHDFNRTTIPYKNRLATTEKFRDPIGYVGSSLNKHFIDVGFPLTEKAHKIAILSRELHSGLATSYKSVITDIILANQGKSDNKFLITAIHRAVYHLSKMMLLSVLVYDSFPKLAWYELHTLHRLACRYDLESFLVKDQLETHGKNSSIDEAYRRIMLFCLASPYKIRQRENIQIFDALLEWAEFTRIYSSDEAPSDTTIVIQQDSDIAPCHGTLSNHTHSKHLIKLDVSELVHRLHEQFDSQSEIKPLWGIESLDKNLLKQLIQLWSTEQKRSFMRTKLNFELHIAVGISNIYHLIEVKSKQNTAVDKATNAPSIDKNHMPRNEFEILSKFSLEPLITDNHSEIRRNNFEVFGPNSRDPDDIDPVISIWDKSENPPRRSKTFVFQTLNESAGGYCLDWRGTQTPKILVGELIGIQSSMSTQQFGVGLVRWMKSNPNESMQVGLQMIAPNAVAMKARKTNQTKQPAHECLLLPEVGTSGQPTSFVCPSFPFKVGDLLTLDEKSNTRKIKLTRLLESSGAISQFQFIYLDQPEFGKKPVDDDAEPEGHVDFENLWSTL